MLEYFEKLGGTRAANPESNYLVMDHYVPYPNNKVAALQKSCLLYTSDAADE